MIRTFSLVAMTYLFVALSGAAVTSVILWVVGETVEHFTP